MNALATWNADSFVRINAQPLFRFLRKTVGAENAEDLTQEVFARFLQRSQKRPMTEEHATRWLFTVARHLSADYHRGHMRLARFPAFDPDGSAFPDARGSGDPGAELREVSELMFSIAAGMDSSGHYRLLLEHLLDRRAGQQEVARRLGVSTRTVRRMIAALYHELQEGLRHRGYSADFFS